MNLTEAEAAELVAAWEFERPIWTLSFKERLTEPWKMRARAFLAAKNKAASDALWDGKSRAAVVRYLVKHGLPDKRHLVMKREIGAREMSRKGAEVMWTEKKVDHRYDWKTVK